MFRSLIAVLLFAGTLHADDRPTPEDVAKAVEESQAEFVKANTPTAADFEEHLKTAQKQLQGAIRTKNREKIPELNDRISELKKQLARAKRGNIDPVEPQLMPLKFAKLAVGTVGRIDEGENGTARIIVDTVLGDDRFLGHRQYSSTTTDKFGRPTGSRRLTSDPVLFVGFAKSADVQEGQGLTWDRDAIVTGRFTYETVLGAPATVPVLEPLDTEKPFK